MVGLVVSGKEVLAFLSLTTTMSLVKSSRVKQPVAVVEQGVEDRQEGHQLQHHPGQSLVVGN